MKNKIHISIPKPCHENWQNMTVTKKGRFCASCQKNVIDFTKSSDREILKTFNANKNLCGRFNDTQLNRDLFLPKEKNTVWIAAASGVLTFLGIGTTISNAQQQEMEQTDNKSSTESLKPENIIHQVSGTVSDEMGPLPTATVFVKGSTNRGTQTDFDGNYTLPAKENEVLVFTFPGCESQVITIGKSNEINVTLNEVKLEYVTVGYMVLKRTFFGRIFHSIGNIFRSKD